MTLRYGTFSGKYVTFTREDVENLLSLYLLNTFQIEAIENDWTEREGCVLEIRFEEIL